MRLLVSLLFVLGCATPRPAPTAPTPVIQQPALTTTPATVQPRSDCPPGYGLLIDERGTACWKGGGHGPPWTPDELPPPDCKPSRCTQSGYLLWDCPEPRPSKPVDPAAVG